MLGPAARASKNEELSLDEALAEWQKHISKWDVMWINLRYVTRITKVEQVADDQLPARAESEAE